MNIVHIGAGTTLAEIVHIAESRDAGNDYFVPGKSTYEQLVRRIMDADEIHVWDITWEFELGLVYFFSVEALHYKLHWRIRIFDGNEGGRSAAWFRRVAKDHADETFVSMIKSMTGVEIVSEVRFELACDAALQVCEDCGLEEECQELLLRIKKNRD